MAGSVEVLVVGIPDWTDGVEAEEVDAKVARTVEVVDDDKPDADWADSVAL